ncbi:synaptotagmin-14-like [Saccoglossus kowalevskii]|uniref:Synaptotagmin-16-like n=1 Tax=Saccoglossus kowalevskii TaxID=10224 RepID=A0ABM0GR60_SACKO|nr:PREDICTED: synaptotagmin-16-like [Saccoglossus kowalevskii]
MAKVSFRSAEGDAYGYEDESSSGDESDNEMLLKFQQSLGSTSKTLNRQPSIRSIRSSSRLKSPSAMESADEEKDAEPDIVDVSHGEESDDGSPEHHGADYAGHGISHFENEGYDSTQVSQAPSLIGGDEDLGSIPALAYGESASLAHGSPERFAAQTFQTGDPELISKCGELETTFSYNGQTKKMTLTIHRARELPSKERGGAHHVQVRMVLLPAKKQRCKTKIKQGENPEWKESFRFSRLPPHELANTGLRFRLYGTERMRKERLIGECVVKFSALNTNALQTLWLQLEPRSNISGVGSAHSSMSDLTRSDSGSSTHSLQHGGIPELLVGLSYNSTTGRLAVEVIKGSHFRNMAMTRPPDTYVKIGLMASSGFEMTRSKTSVRRGQPNPTFKETFIFQVAQFQLPDVTVMCSVYNKRSMKKKEMIGWFSMGLNNSSEEELSHWNEMRESKGHQVCRWHVLLES